MWGSACLVLLAVLLTACRMTVSLSGGTVDARAKTVVVATFPNNASLVNPTLSQVFTTNLENKIQGMTPLTLVDNNGDYEFEYNLLDVATMLRAYEPYYTLAALSHATGINQHQLSHYANGLKHPRPQQRQRIVEGMHEIGRQLLAVE